MGNPDNELARLEMNPNNLEPRPLHGVICRWLRKLRGGQDDSTELESRLKAEQMVGAQIIETRDWKDGGPFTHVEVIMGDGSRREALLPERLSDDVDMETLLDRINPRELWDPMENPF